MDKGASCDSFCRADTFKCSINDVQSKIISRDVWVLVYNKRQSLVWLLCMKGINKEYEDSRILIWDQKLQWNVFLSIFEEKSIQVFTRISNVISKIIVWNDLNNRVYSFFNSIGRNVWKGNLGQFDTELNRVFFSIHHKYKFSCTRAHSWWNEGKLVHWRWLNG